MNKYLKGLQFTWHLPAFDKKKVSLLALELNINQAVASILYLRGFDTKKKAESFLFPYLDSKEHHSKHILNMEKALERIKEALKNNEKILIVGDYDVDGITSTCLLFKALTKLNGNVNFYLPHRVKDGYGLSKKIVEKALSHKFSLIITVDNGISAFEALAFAKEHNIDVIVTDHHQPPEILPEGAFCIVNPHQKECPYPFKELAGVGVTFKLVQLLFETFHQEITQDLYELFLLGTIADVVPLIGENRYLVKQILSSIKNKESFQFKILKQNAKLEADKLLTSMDIGFSLAPQINAIGRLDDPRRGVIFFLEKNEQNLSDLGEFLFNLNKQRKELELKIVEEIHKNIQRDINLTEEVCIIQSSRLWQPGLVGLVAARISNHYGRPSIILHETEDGLLKGSLRSIPECDLYECLNKIPKNLLLNFGGHMGAAGITLKKEHLEEFKHHFKAAVLSVCSYQDLVPKIYIDALMDVNEITDTFFKELQLLEPFGNLNHLPIFYFSDVTIVDKIQLLKELHVKFKLFSNKKPINVMFFNKPELYNLLLELKLNSKIDIVGKITENRWNNKVTFDIIGIDLKIY